MTLQLRANTKLQMTTRFTGAKVGEKRKKLNQPSNDSDLCSSFTKVCARDKSSSRS